MAVNNVKNVKNAKKAIKKAFQNQIDGKGFSLVEVVSACPTNWGMTPQKALEWVESDMLPYYPIGVYKDRSAAKEDKKYEDNSDPLCRFRRTGHPVLR